MVMVGGVEIAVDLNLEGIEQTLKELEKQFNSTKFGVNVGIDASAYNKLQQDINRVRDRVVVKKICVPIDICDDSINKVERKFYAIKRKLENSPINIKVNYSQQKGGFSGSVSGGSRGSGIEKNDIKNIGRDIVNELKALRKDVVSGFGNSVSSTNNTTSAIGPIRMMGSVVGELKTIARNTKKQGLISSLIGSAVDGFVMGAMNKSGAKFAENFNKALPRASKINLAKTKNQLNNAEKLKEQYTKDRSSLQYAKAGKKPGYVFVEGMGQIPKETQKEYLNQINQAIEEIDKQQKKRIDVIQKLEIQIEKEFENSWDFLGGKQLAIKTTRLKKFGDSVAKNVFAFNDLKEVKDVTLDAMGTLFNAFTDEKFYKEMEDIYVDYMQQVEILGKDAKVEQEKAIKRLTGRFDRVSERVSARVIGGTLKSVAQPLRVNKRVMTANSAKMAFDQLPYMGNNVLSEKEREGAKKAKQFVLFMGGVAPMTSKPGEPNVSTTIDGANALAGILPNTFVKAVTNTVSNSLEKIKDSPTYGGRQIFAQFAEEYKDLIDKIAPGNTLQQDMGALLAPHPIDRAIQVNVQGFDEDAVKLAIQALAMAKEFPDTPIALIGGSGGGYSVEEAISIIEQFKKQYPEMAHIAKNIKGGLGIGTPDFNLTRTAPTDLYKSTLGDRDHFTPAVLGILDVKDEVERKKILSRLPGEFMLPQGAIRPSEGFFMVKGGDNHAIQLMMKEGLSRDRKTKRMGELSQKASHIFNQEGEFDPTKLNIPTEPGSINLTAAKGLLGNIEAALWHFTEEGPANKWSIDESLTATIPDLEKLIQSVEKGNVKYENGVRLQQMWMTSFNNFIKGGVKTKEGEALLPYLEKVGEEISKLTETSYDGSIYKIISEESAADSYKISEGGFRTREQAQEWLKQADIKQEYKDKAQIVPHIGDVMWRARNITEKDTLDEVKEKHKGMPTNTATEKQLKSVVASFIAFQEKDLELYKQFLQEVLALRKQIANGDDSAKTELKSLFESSPFSVVRDRFFESGYKKKVGQAFKTSYATYPELDKEKALELGQSVQSLIGEYIETAGIITPEIKEKAGQLVSTYKFLADSLESLNNKLHNVPPVTRLDDTLVNDPTSFQSLLNLNTKLPEQYQLNPYSSKVLGEGFTGRAIGDMEKGIVVKYPTVTMEDVRRKIGSPLEVEAQEKLGQKGLSPLAIREATKQGEFFTATLIKGKTLQSIRDTVDSAKLKKVAKLLADIHKEGFVHLDMSLANIMETEAGDLVAIDFANVQRATKELMGLDLETAISRSSLEEDQGKELRQYYKEYMDQISAVPIPDTSNITQEVEKVQQAVSTGIVGTVKKYLEDLGKEIYAAGLDKTLNKESAQEAINRIDNALEGLKRLKEVLPDKIPNRKGKLAPTGNVIGGYSSQLIQAKNKILEGNPQVPINFKLGQLTKDIVAGLELTGSDAGALIEFADSITDPVTGRIKENWDIHSPSGFTEWCKNMLIAGLKLTGMDRTKIETVGKQISLPLKESLKKELKSLDVVLADSMISVNKVLANAINPDAIITPAPRQLAGLLPSSEMLKKAKEDYLMEWVSFLQDVETVRMRYNFETAWQDTSNITKLLPPAKESTNTKPLVTPAPKQITGLLPSSEMAKNLRAINETMQMISILQDTEMVRMRFNLDTNWNKSSATKLLPPAEGFTPAGFISGSSERKEIETSLAKIYKEIIKLLPSIEALQKEQEKSNIEYLIDFLKSTDIVQARLNLDQSWANPQNSTLSLPTRDTSLAGFLPSSEIIEQRRLREKQLIQQQRESQRGIVSTAAEIFPPEALNNLITVSTQRLLPSAELRQKEAESRIQSLREIANVARELNGLVEVLPFRNEAIVTSPNTLATRDATADQEEKRQVVTLAREFFDPRVFGRTSRDTVEEQNREIRALPGFGFRQNNDQAPGPRQSSLDGAINFFGPPAMLATSIGLIVSFREQLMALGAEALAVATRFEVLTNTLNYLSGGTVKGAEKFEQLSGLANKLGVDFESLITSYNRLAASTRLTPLEGTTTDLLTEGVAQAGKTFGMSNEEMSGSILALSQLASKGVVSAEELRSQLSERIPGSFQIASRAMKMTEKELFQLMATGQLASTDFLPKFAKQLNLESAAGVTGSASGAISAMNRLQNSVRELQLELGKILLPIQTFGLQVANVFVGILGDNVGTILKRVTLAMTGFLVGSMPFGAMLTGWVVNLKNLALSLGGVQVLLKMLKEGMITVFSSFARVLAVAAAKAIVFSTALNLLIDVGLVLFKVYSKTTVWDEWAKAVEYNAKRVKKAFEEVNGPGEKKTSAVSPINQIKKTGNGFFDYLFTADTQAVEARIVNENKKRKSKGLGPMTAKEEESLVSHYNNLSPYTQRMDENAKIKRDEISRMVDTTMMAPIQNAIELFQQKQGPLMEASTIDAIVKSKKARLSVLGPMDTKESSQLKREISTAEERRNSVMAPYESAEGGLRESLRQDQEKLAQYEQALRDQTSGDADKRKKAEDFLRSPGIDEASMQIVKENIRQTTDALIAYDKEMAKAGLISDTQKLAKAMMELSVAFQSVETRLNNVHLNKLKAITQGKVKGFSSDRFNLENTAIKEAEENYNNTNRQIKERQKTIKQLEDDLALNPAKESADQLILNEETRKGRKLTPEEIGILSKTWGEGNEQLKQALDAEAIIRQEKIKTGEMEKQSAEELYAIREARQAHYLAIYEDAMDEIKQLDQRNLSNAMTGANNQLARGLRSDLGAEDDFNVKTTGMQYIKVQKDIENNALAMKSLQQAYYEGKLSLEQYTTKSRALLTEDAQLKQQLVEQEISYIKAISQARMNALQRIKESRDANTEIANSGRTEAITKTSISKFRTDEFLTNNESLAQAKNGLVEIQNQLKNTNSELSELEEAYAGGKGPLLLNDYIQKKRQLLITQAQQESQLATAEMARMRAIEDYRLAMLDRMRDVSNNKNAILNAEALTQLAQSQMTGQVGDSQVSRQSTEIALDNAKKAVEVAKESLTQIQKAYRKKELSAEKYKERLRAINLEIAQANQSVAEQELALWKAKEQEKISILEKSLEKQDRLNKLNAIKTKINNTEQLAGMLASGGTSDLTSSIFSNQETNVSQDQSISSLTNKLAGLKGIVNPTKDLQDKILATEQELNEAVLTKRLNLLSQSLEYKKQMLNATQLENKSIENQLNMIDSQHKLQQAFVEITKKRLENEIVSMERIKTLSDEIGSSSIESVQFRSQFDDAIASKRLKTLDIELKANVRNLEIEQHREKLSQRKAENESRLAVIQAKNSLLIANQSGNSDAIALAQQQFQLANESLSTVLQQGQAMNQLHDTQKTKLALEHQGTLQAEKYAKIQDTINSKLKTANSYLDKQKERLDSINELNKAINNARTNVLEKQTGISDRKIDLYDAINGTEKITDPKQNAVLMKELEAQLKAIGGSTDPEAMYAERLRLEESLANQKMNALVAEQNMQKTLLQIEFDKYELQAQALILQAKMLALQSKGTENEASANQLADDAMKGLDALQNRRQDAMEALGINQETERYNQGIENANAINDARRKSAEAGYRPKGDPVKYPTATGEAGKTIKELLTGNSQRFGYAPSFDLNQAVKGLRGGNGIDIGRVNIPSPSNEPTYTPLNMNEELLTPNLTENTERNTKAMYDLSNSIISLTEALVNNKPGLEINAPVANNNPVSTPTGQPTTTGGQQVINNVNYGGITVISSDPTGDARKVLNDLAKANKNRL